MDEPDGVAGAAAIRNEEPSLQEQILQYESTGCISIASSLVGVTIKSFLTTGNVLDAAVCYQKAIEQDPNKLANQVVCIYVLLLKYLIKMMAVKCFSNQVLDTFM